ncbi:MAG: hypothetical protein ABIK45_06315 [Pseudomonadota bacterium]
MKKFLTIGIGVLIIGVIAIIVLAILNLGSIVKTATETYGPRITKTEVRLRSADISILSGSGSLNKFLLGNPEGFTMPSALECETIWVSVVKKSLTTDTIIIEEVIVDGPIISYEKRGNTDNFKTILNNIKQTVASEKNATPAEQEATGSEKSIQINNFIVKNGRINLGGSLLEVFGADKGVGIAMPDIHMKDIGKDKKITPAEAFALVLAEMTSDVTGTVTQFGKQLSETLGKAVDEVGKGTESLGSTVKGFFGSE